MHYIEASTSLEIATDPFGASSAHNYEETSSIAEFSCAIFSISILRLSCLCHIIKQQTF